VVYHRVAECGAFVITGGIDSLTEVRLMRYLWSGLLAVAIVACGDSVMEPESKEHYTLRSVNGLELPYKLAEVGETRLDVSHGEMTLGSNGHVTRALTIRVTTPEDEYFQQHYGATYYEEDLTQVALGRWVLEGRNLRLNLAGRELLGVVEGGAITLSERLRGVTGRNIDGNVVIAPGDYPLSFVFQR
jgi:hypothetical protein